MEHARPKGSHRPLLGLFGLLLLAGLVYWPGRTGDFLFDDFINLPALGATGPIGNSAAFWRFITSGTADPTGRPLALLTFLLDARDWPAAAEPFLRTNILLHLCNGALLFALLRRLGRAVEPVRARSDGAALFAAGMWLLHPLLVSTTLYIIQREAMLATTFVLAGLLAWWHGRESVSVRPRTGMAWMVAGIGAGTLLALLCKGNGILLPLLALILDATLPGTATGPMPKRFRQIALATPSLLLLAYIGSQAFHSDAYHPERNWTLAQRLLSEPRVLFDYLRLLWIPRSLSTGLFNESYVASTSLWQPATTLPALVALVALIVGAWQIRHRQPALSAAVLFYFGAHALESSTIPLELYFEHRNYLPAVLMFWPVGLAIARWQARPAGKLAIGAALLLALASITAQRVELWRNPERQARLWALSNPSSARAQATAAIWETRSGRPDLAIARLDPRWRAAPDELQFALNYVDARCLLDGLDPGTIARVAKTLQSATRGDQLLFQWMERSIDVARQGSCRDLDLRVVESWADAIGANRTARRTRSRTQNFESLRGELALAHGDAPDALAHFNRALDAFPTASAAGKQTALLATAGAYREAMAHLDHYDLVKSTLPRPGPGMPWLHALVLDRQGYWPHEFAILRGKLREALAQSDADAEPGDTRAH